MSDIGKPERATQRRVIKLLCDELSYRYLGNWSDRPSNGNVEEGLLAAFLTRSGYTQAQIASALYRLRTEAANPNRSLYDNNRHVYSLLRYGVLVKIEAGKVTETVHLVNWHAPDQNDFAIAEEVTLHGNHERRPDLVLYLNGIAIGVLELKNSRVSIGDGIRQNLSNQLPHFNTWFFSMVQFIFAGNDTEGLQYGTSRERHRGLHVGTRPHSAWRRPGSAAPGPAAEGARTARQRHRNAGAAVRAGAATSRRTRIHPLLLRQH
jgi:type I restriction enzyme R subunit